MSDTFTEYRKYPSVEHDQSFLDLLEDNEIEYHVEKTAPSFDVTFAQNQLGEDIVIKLKAFDFERANELLEKVAIESYNIIEKDYYLFEFTDEELMDIIAKPYEWNLFDYQLAQQILKERGKSIPVELTTALKRSKIEELEKTESSPVPWIWAGYILSLVGGLLGFFIGWHLLASNKVLPDGKRIKTYDSATQFHGKCIMIVGGFCIIIWLIIRLTITFYI
ncbi:hypothetical protein [Xanthocytophaga flava]|uniref:hypothetical protein n=1 Tax=Xanthocytophaga flava TaxID=3048013 RepID=UPI0028D69090|nr:hypothetical protein [Xanthocytophaga flavus]MDJ1468787.1 hypothetical protein [Xanthocytophaga flavus]